MPKDEHGDPIHPSELPAPPGSKPLPSEHPPASDVRVDAERVLIELADEALANADKKWTQSKRLSVEWGDFSRTLRALAAALTKEPTNAHR
jgi:hypothetical protein